MAKTEAQVYDVSEFLKATPQLPPVFDATEFCNRPFTLTSVEWRDFPASARNNYNASRKLIMHVSTIDNGKEYLLETTQRGIVEPVQALQTAGYMPCNLMIVKEGKYCTIQAR